MATSDDDVREIQLSGKQLVFLFMAVTVVSVVIFLCGVLVGRGVQTRAATPVATAMAAADEDTAEAPTSSAPAAPPVEPTKASGLDYQNRLEGKAPVAETLTTSPPASAPGARPTAGASAPGASTSTPAAASSASPSPATAAAAKAPPPATANAFPEPRGDGFAIQVAALTGRTEAESIASRLKGKGYAVYLVSALPGQPAGYKVRVGKFTARADAEKIATRLEREEQFKPWITR